MPNIKVAPSILSADFGKLNEEISSIEKYADLLHIDVMDGHFVSNITIGPVVVNAIKTKLPLDVHLMIENPERYINNFTNASCITIHYEACKTNINEIIGLIKKIKKKAGVSINPNTGIRYLIPLLDKIDLCLLMTVNPGFAGQGFIESVLKKIKALRDIADRKKLNVDIEVDGGINIETGRKAVSAGANILVAGSYIFKSKDRINAILDLKKL